MKATWKAGLVIGAAILATLAIGVVQTKADKNTLDLTGTWTLDPAKSDLPAGGQLRRWGGGGGGGGWAGRGGGGEGRKLARSWRWRR